MHISVILFLTTLIIYIPMAGILLYVWYKFGKGDGGVRVARSVYLAGSVFILGVMFFI